MGMDKKEQAEVQEFFNEVDKAGWDSPSDIAWIKNLVYRAWHKGRAKGFEEGMGWEEDDPRVMSGRDRTESFRRFVVELHGGKLCNCGEVFMGAETDGKLVCPRCGHDLLDDSGVG